MHIQGRLSGDLILFPSKASLLRKRGRVTRGEKRGILTFGLLCPRMMRPVLSTCRLQRRLTTIGVASG